MHPNAFLETYWGMDLKPRIFVAMSFAPQYEDRFNQVIAPAIQSITISNVALTAYRVDISKSGDSILTDIMDGIAHSQMIVADISSIGKDSVSGIPYRNANVMYEVGVALACRQPSEVLLVRDDSDKFLFDVSTILHMHLDFTDVDNARTRLNQELLARLRERNLLEDIRVKTATAQLSAEEVRLLKHTFEYEPNTVWGKEVKGLATWYALATARLLDKRIIRVAGEFENGNTAFQFTQLDWYVRQTLKDGLRKIPLPEAEPATENQEPTDNEDNAT